MNSIRTQLTRSLMLGTALLVGGGGAGAYFCMRSALTGQFDDALRAKAQAIAALAEMTPDGRVDMDLPSFQLPSFKRESPRDYFEIWSAEGAVIARSDSLGESHLSRPVPAPVFPVIGNMELARGVSGRALSMTFSPRPADEIERPNLRVVLTLVTASRRQELDQALGAQLLGLGGGVLLLLLATTLMVPRVLARKLRSLDNLSERAESITASSLNTRFDAEEMPAELKPITRRFNDLLARLEAAFERERQYGADLAHELRTPLAELRCHAEFAVKWPDCRAENCDRETLAIALHMEAIVTRLLALARSENSPVPLRREMVEISSVLEEVWRPLGAKADERQIKTSFQLPRQIQCETDPDLFREILTNLLSNAVEYSPLGGHVEITASISGGLLALAISNTVQDLDAGDIPKMFDRFWRKESARTGAEHAGLGLSLSRSFAQALGWNLTASLENPARLRMALTGPSGSSETAGDGKRLPGNASETVNTEGNSCFCKKKECGGKCFLNLKAV